MRVKKNGKRRKKEKNGDKNRRDNHHSVPTSAGGPNKEWNKFSLKRFMHEKWHILFGNHVPSVCIAIIKEWINLSADGFIDTVPVDRKKKDAWSIVFKKSGHNGDSVTMTLKEGIKFIEEFFLPAQEIFIEWRKKNKKKRNKKKSELKKLFLGDENNGGNGNHGNKVFCNLVSERRIKQVPVRQVPKISQK